jgi:hypothetical protein
MRCANRDMRSGGDMRSGQARMEFAATRVEVNDHAFALLCPRLSLVVHPFPTSP